MLNFTLNMISLVGRGLYILESVLCKTELHKEAVAEAELLLEPGSTWSRSFLISHVYLLLLAKALPSAIAEAYGAMQVAGDTMTVRQAATELAISEAFVLDLVASDKLCLVADGHITVDSVRSMAGTAHKLYMAKAEAEYDLVISTASAPVEIASLPADAVSNFATKPPNNGAPSTAGSGGSR